MWATNAKIIAVVLATLAFYTLIANEIPQVRSEVPHTLTLGPGVTPEQLVAAGEKVFNGIGGCTACHGLGTRAPNLLTDEKGTGPIGARCGKREPGKSCKEYLFERLDNPNAVLLPGYQPIMPRMTTLLSVEQVWAVIAFLESQDGTVDVTADDIAKAKGATSTPAGPAPSAAGAPGAGAAGGGAFAGGSTDPQTIIKAAGCLACHKLEGQGQTIAPDLTHVGSRRDANSLRSKILNPMSSIAKGYEKFAGIMPKTFGTMMNAAQLEVLVAYLAGHK
ncbi:MAG TPA: c-type cytochrome [Gemmatimonadales bacterium]|nr:c-type cytochrome [Gemmatimonadales bacterium]